mmetsp:Transcript_20207/g.47140  ORF Transcript_20207/g.47140 Transcript_20207/m.47140 type:complete len:294 (+) Transcript_20207:62-943(+)
MARLNRKGRLFCGLILIGATALCSSWSSRTSSSDAPGPAFVQAMLSPQSLLQLVLLQVPGLFLAAAGSLIAGASAMRWISNGRAKWPAAVALVFLALVTAQALIAQSPLPARIDSSDASGSATSKPQPLPKSGEETLRKGAFKRIPDPRAPEGDKVIDADWRNELWKSMTEAQNSGVDQVVLMFSMKNCPWCDKQVAALRKSLQLREAAKKGAEEAVLFGDTLRVFIFDYEEFAAIAQKLGIESFPSMLFFGKPGVMPRLSRGYIDEGKLEEVLKEIAREKPHAPRRKRRFFR